MKKGVKKATMSDIAKMLGVSKNSVSLALNEKPGVSDDLRRRITELAQKMDYGRLSNLASSKSKCLIVVVPNYIRHDTFFYSDVFWAIEEESKLQSCITITTSLSAEDEKELVLPTIPQEMNVLGFLLVGITSDLYLEKLHQSGLPIVSVDISHNNVATNSISSTNIASGYLATKHLIECGHRQIAFVGPIFVAQSVYERWCGFEQAMLQYGLDLFPKCNILGSKDQVELFDTVEVLGKYLKDFTCFPTAWFCAGDRIAVAMISILSRKFKIPDEISIIGFDDLPIAQTVKPKLTTIHVDRKLMGKMAVTRLLQLQVDRSQILSICLPGQLIIRDSVRNLTVD